MPKPVERTKNSHTEEEMRNALKALQVGQPEKTIAPHYDAAELIIADLIEEVLEHRARFERFRGFVHTEYAAMQRR